MENCFRFLINVDQCLNMSHFDIFFYELESRHKFRMHPVQMFSDSPDVSLRKAAMDIRMYLDRYPYHVGDYQIIVAMRSQFKKVAERWEETMLYRLLQLSLELHKARIFISSRENIRKALNLVMLYDANFSLDLPSLGKYKASTRFRDDCFLLMKHLGLEEKMEREQVLRALEAYRVREDRDEAALYILEEFVKSRDSGDEIILMDANVMGEEPPRLIAPIQLEMAPFLKEKLANFQVFEMQIDRNNRRQNILALLRVVEFINMSVEPPSTADGKQQMEVLSYRCEKNWDAVWSDPALEQRYANMLQRYQSKLRTVSAELERPRFITPNAKELPPQHIPEETAIISEDSLFSGDMPKANGVRMRKLLDNFLRSSFSVSTMAQEWKEVYQQIRVALNRMEHELKVYAEDMSRQYAAILDERKATSLTWKASSYSAGETIEKDISQLEYERDQRLQQLKSPHMNPSLSFQDQLNMENSLEQGNLNIEFLIRCLSTVTVANFLNLAGLCALVFVLHYTVLQPYALQGVDTLVYYLLYVVAVLVIMLLCWRLPYQHFHKRLKNCVSLLQSDMDKFINGYYEKAQHFCTYINLLNQLDYITRRHRLLVRANVDSHKLSQGYLWHKVQIQNHLSKLQFFQGLIELGEVSPEEQAEDARSLPSIEGSKVCNVVDSPIYWPNH